MSQLFTSSETAQEPGASSEHVTAVLSFLASLVPSMVVMMAVGYLGDGDVKHPRHDLAQFLAQSGWSTRNIYSNNRYSSLFL